MKNKQKSLPLEGIVVLEAAPIIAGPFIGTQLAEFGAEVIKFEQPNVGDPLRNMATTGDGESLWFASTGRNKKSIEIDLSIAEGQDVFKKMVEKADVVIEAFRPGTFNKWGLDYKTLSAINPGLIMTRISGYGQTGPLGGLAGFGRTCQAFGGLTNLTGFSDRPPITTPYPMGDYNAALMGSYATMLALYHRDVNNGVGQEIDLAIYETVFRQLEFLAPEFHETGKIRERSEPFSANTGPTGTWQSKDEKWVAITITTDMVFKRMCKAISRPDLANNPKYKTQRQRKKHEKELSEILVEWVGSRDAKEVVKILNEHNAPTNICMSIEDIFTDEHYKARNMLPEIYHPRLGSLTVPGVVPKLSETPGKIKSLGPDLGEDTVEILENMLGFTKADLQILRDKKVILPEEY